MTKRSSSHARCTQAGKVTSRLALLSASFSAGKADGLRSNSRFSRSRPSTWFAEVAGLEVSITCGICLHVLFICKSAVGPYNLSDRQMLSALCFLSGQAVPVSGLNYRATWCEQAKDQPQLWALDGVSFGCGCHVEEWSVCGWLLCRPAAITMSSRPNH